MGIHDWREREREREREKERERERERLSKAHSPWIGSRGARVQRRWCNRERRVKALVPRATRRSNWKWSDEMNDSTSRRWNMMEQMKCRAEEKQQLSSKKTPLTCIATRINALTSSPAPPEERTSSDSAVHSRASSSNVSRSRIRVRSLMRRRMSRNLTEFTCGKAESRRGGELSQGVFCGFERQIIVYHMSCHVMSEAIVPCTVRMG
jgi:hypothetical protein